MVVQPDDEGKLAASEGFVYMSEGCKAAPPVGIDDFVKAAIEQYRAKLLDLSSRNPLVNFRHSDRSRSQVRVVHEVPERLFDRLESSQQLWFDPLEDPVLQPPDEARPLFQQALRSARRADGHYRSALDELGPNASDRKKQKIERELANKVRIQMGLDPYEPTLDPKKRAAELGISVEYDLPLVADGNGKRHADSKLSTLFFREDLDRKLSGLRDSARSLLQDAGLSALFCALGFLEYYESEDSDEKRIAPLVFYPIELDRELQEGEYRYFIRGKNEDVEVNVALRELLKREYAIELPEWKYEEGDSDPLGKFLASVSSAISSRRDWKVRRFVTVGLFTFSTLVMYKDLDPVNWPATNPLHDQPLLRTLIAGAEIHGSSFASDYEIDQILDPDALLITDADSSQHSAVIDVLKGKNTVIQGPPGTGKSQTITNIISSALYAGKKVLFIAEKMAALDVVKKRLDAGGLGPFCLELHSSKTSKTAVVGSLASRLEYQAARPRHATIASNLDAIQKARADLIYYVEKTNEPAGKTGMTVRDVLIGSAIRENDRKALPQGLGTARLPNALEVTPHIRTQMAAAAANLELQTVPLRDFGGLSSHPWRGLQNHELTALDTDRLLSSLHTALTAVSNLIDARAVIEKLTDTKLPGTLQQISAASSSALNLASPSELVDGLVFPALSSDASRQSLRELIESIEKFLNAIQALSSCVSDWRLAARKGSAAAGECLSLAIKLCVDDLTTVECKSRLRELGEKQQLLRNCSKFAADISTSFGTSQNDVRVLKAALEALQRLESLPRDSWIAKDAPVLQESNRHLIKEAASACTALRRRRQVLTSAWDSALIPAASTLKSYVVALRSANWFTSLFTSGCRSARSLMKVAAVGRDRKFGRRQLAVEYSKWAQLLDDEERFANDRSLLNTIGERFRGVDTDFDILVRLSDWAEETRVALIAYASIGQSFCKELFEASSDRLRTWSALAADPRYQQLAKALVEVPAGDSRTLDEINQDLEGEAQELNAILFTASMLTFLDNLQLSNLRSVALRIKTVEEGRWSIEQSNKELRLPLPSDPGTDQIQTLRSTLNYAEAVSQVGFPPSLTIWLHQDLRNVHVLKQSMSNLSDLAAKVIKFVGEVDQIAKLDWRLWCQCEDRFSADIALMSAKFDSAIEHVDRLQDYINFLLAEDFAEACGLAPVLSVFICANEGYRDLAIATDFVFFRSAAEQLLNADTKLHRHSGSNHDQLRTRYQQLDKEFIALRRELLAQKLSDYVVPAGVSQGRVADLTELALVQHIAGQVRPRIALRDLFKRAGRALQALKPCWMMSPMSVAQFLESGQVQFDLVLMDEASQIRPEEALGAIARGSQVVVVGDQMQLPPTSFFQRLSAEGAANDDEELEDVQQESVLEAAAARFYPARMLKWHYRSEHGSLISFSNHEFYGDDLTVFPSPFHEHPEYGVKLIQVDGVYGSGVNPEEGRVLIQEAGKFMALNPQQSLGIVAVNSKQAELIRELMDELCAADPNAEAYRVKWATGLESSFVKNLENVQGDERDVIFVSTVYGKDATGNFYQRFGPINSAYGHRRLNVLFTRAKKKVVIFTSMRAEDIVDEGKSWGVRALKGYLQYARTGSAILPKPSQSECDSEFEEWVLRALRANGFDAVPQLGFAGYRLDLAVRHPKHPGTFLCGIECDGATYHSARSVRERDRLRQEVLNRLGWNIYRIWSTDWFRNPTLQTKNLLAHLTKLALE